MRARLPFQTKKCLALDGSVLVLSMPEHFSEQFRAATVAIAEALPGVENLPVIPRELEDILAISTTERHRWLKDGRLPSAGTRTVKLHGRAKMITFHVFDPRRVEEILDRVLVDAWREDDVVAAAENRRRAAATRALTRSRKNAPDASGKAAPQQEGTRPSLAGWEAFEREGLLR
jgi:hypothetical protein